MLISSSAVPTPPLEYGGLESIAANLVVELAKRKHDVTLVTTKGTLFKGQIQLTGPDKEPLGTITTVETIEPSWGNDSEMRHYNAYRKLMEQDFCNGGDAVILDFTWSGFPYISIQGYAKTGILPHPNAKIVHVHHGMIQQNIPPQVPYPRFAGVSMPHAELLSKTMRIPVRHFWNGIQLPPETEMTGKKNDGFLLSLNRISKEKGIHNSIDVAIGTNTPIIVVGDDRWVYDQMYVQRIIQQCKNSHGLAKYYGLVDNATKIDLIKRCKALISCTENTWMEAFGLYVCEGNAYGKATIGVANGGLLDTIVTGQNGFLAMNPERAKEFVTQVDQIEPEVCYNRVKENFTVERMGDYYEKTLIGVAQDEPAFYW